MSLVTRPLLPSAITRSRVVIVARRLDRKTLENLVELGVSGSTVFEVTLDGVSALEDIEWLTGIGAITGAGTVTSVEGGQAAVDAGAQFLVSPYLDETLVAWASERGLPIAPGALTPTEIVRAWSLGAAAVKIFPASVAGPSLIREVRGPLGHIPLMPTGGISASNAAAFIEAGAVAVGVGGWLTSARDNELTRRWRELVHAVGSPSFP